MKSKTCTPFRKLGRCALLLLVLSCTLPYLGNAQAPPRFSIDFQGPTAAGGVFSPDDVLAPGPGVILSGAVFGLIPSPLTGQVEIDAMSKCSKSLKGPPIHRNKPGEAFIDFSVDEFAAGIATSPAPPNVFSEGASWSREASADIFNLLNFTLPPIPSPVYGNTALFDGNGVYPWGGPGLGLVERNPPTNVLPDRGDNLDALFYQNLNSSWTFFSLDAAWVDPLEGAPANSGTAAANGYAPGDILVYIPGATPAVRVYAQHQLLGLGPFDDVDALVIHESGDGVYRPSPGPYQWDDPPPYGHDMLLFSVRRGSPIIGTLDTYRALPIEEGDILMVMNQGMTTPGIFIPAEALGLRTVRGLYTLPSGYADDLDAMDVPYLGSQPPNCDPQAVP